MKEVSLLWLRCRDGCGSRLIILDDNHAECSYCKNLYHVTNMEEILMTKEEEQEDVADYFLKGGVSVRTYPYSDYFYSPGDQLKNCTDCAHLDAEGNWWKCKWRGIAVSGREICSVFEKKPDYPYGTVYPEKTNYCGDCSHHKTHWWHGKDWCGKLKEPAYYLRSACKDFEEKHD